MLFYIKCPSCSRTLSSNLDKYFADYNAILNDPKKSKTQKESEGAELLNKYGYEMICCRIRMMGIIPAHEIIQT